MNVASCWHHTDLEGKGPTSVSGVEQEQDLRVSPGEGGTLSVATGPATSEGQTREEETCNSTGGGFSDGDIFREGGMGMTAVPFHGTWFLLSWQSGGDFPLFFCDSVSCCLLAGAFANHFLLAFAGHVCLPERPFPRPAVPCWFRLRNVFSVWNVRWRMKKCSARRNATLIWWLGVVCGPFRWCGALYSFPAL